MTSSRNSQFFRGVVFGSVITLLVCLVLLHRYPTSPSYLLNPNSIVSFSNISISKHPTSEIKNVIFKDPSESSVITARPASKRLPSIEKIIPISKSDKQYDNTMKGPNTIGFSQEKNKNQSYGTETARMSRSQCRFKYGTRGYFPLTARRLPPMLYTFPGSGNTW